MDVCTVCKMLWVHLANIAIFHQIAALTPVVETAKQFTKDYKSFATAVDTTRHELPVQNFYIDGDRMEFLGFCFYFVHENNTVNHNWVSSTLKRIQLICLYLLIRFFLATCECKLATCKLHVTTLKKILNEQISPDSAVSFWLRTYEMNTYKTKIRIFKQIK